MYLIFSIALTVCFLLALVLALTKKWLHSAKFERISALVFGAIFVARFYSHHEYAIDNITGLAQSPLSPFLTVLTTVSIWMGYAAVMLLILKPFYKVSALSEAVKFFCTPVMLLMGVCLAIYYLTHGIFYDGESFLVASFRKKDRVYRYEEIQQQKLYLVQGGNIIIELYLRDGSSVSLQSSMDGIYLFLDTAFAGWCLQKGIDPRDCTFHDPSKSWWFPHEEEI